MTSTSPSPDRFEERLLGELRRVVAERPAPAAPVAAPRRRPVPRPRVALVGAGLVAAAATAVVISGGDPATPAYAVQPHADGTVTVQINSLRDADGLERKLRAAGVPADVTYLPTGRTCAPGRFTEAKGPGWVRTSTRQTQGSGVTFTVERDGMPAGATLVIESSGGDPSAGVQRAGMRLAFADGAVGACTPVDAPDQPASPASPAPDAGGRQTGSDLQGGESRSSDVFSGR
jgi:hypothetical protein